ncbi:MAG TPA: 4a-hydroxytetrahydrobiopterin dehydratase [Chloroflexota bacterium]|nr:4a-hydroxytetrahydrobiopterin dehydratase [Chloroflexota bacterium]
MSVSLADRVCVPCRGGVPPLTPEEIAPLLAQLEEGWTVEENKKLVRTYRFKNFAEAMAFANRVAAIAEEQGHHPDLHVRWGAVRVEVWTHKIDGLTESDFIFAAKCDRAFAEHRAAAAQA